MCPGSPWEIVRGEKERVGVRFLCLIDPPNRTDNRRVRVPNGPNRAPIPWGKRPHLSGWGEGIDRAHRAEKRYTLKSLHACVGFESCHFEYAWTPLGRLPGGAGEIAPRECSGSLSEQTRRLLHVSALADRPDKSERVGSVPKPILKRGALRAIPSWRRFEADPARFDAKEMPISS